MKKIELTLVIIALIGFLFGILYYPGGDFLLVLSTSLLAVQYFYLSFALLNNIKLRQIFRKSSYSGIETSAILSAIFTGIFLSIIILGLMFKLLGYPGGDMMLIVGLPFAFIGTVISLIKLRNEKKPIHLNTVKRGLILVSLALIAFFTPYKTWVDLKYPHHPEYAKVLIQLNEHTDDIELLKEEQRLREQMMEERRTPQH